LAQIVAEVIAFHTLNRTSVMAVSAITSIKNIIGFKGSARKGPEVKAQRDELLEPVPTVGFRVGYTRGTSKLLVRVLGARHLPAKFGITPAVGYAVKVCTSALDIGEWSASRLSLHPRGKILTMSFKSQVCLRC
jgi:hypothetical protein